MSATLNVGDRAPAFDRAQTGGASCSLQSLSGRKAVLYFYPKDDTSGCTREAIDFNALRSEFAAADTAVIGVSPDSIASHDKFKAKHGIDVPLVSDESKAMLQSFGVWVEKSMYGKRYLGVERTTFLLDPEGRIARIWTKVSVPGHAQEVLEAAKALG